MNANSIITIIAKHAPPPASAVPKLVAKWLPNHQLFKKHELFILWVHAF